MIANTLERLMDLIGYPREERSGTERSAVLMIDDYRIEAEVREGQLVFSWKMGADESDYASLANFAAGRLLAEEAALAYDPEQKTMLLWQAVPTTAKSQELVRGFENFVNSCDWWSARLQELQTKMDVNVPEMVIRP